jgi:ribosomal-protein-alanine N-acetyltransferase
MTAEDRSEVTRLARASADLYHPWIYAPTTDEEYDSYLARFDQRSAEGLLICIRDTDILAGFVNISEIVRGPYQRASIGYGAFAPSADKGYMTEGLRLLFHFAFDDLDLHRLEADIQPGNTRSLNLVKRLGFQYEGYSPGYIRIRDEWTDHERWAITKDMLEPGLTSELA